MDYDKENLPIFDDPIDMNGFEMWLLAQQKAQETANRFPHIPVMKPIYAIEPPMLQLN